MPARFRTSPKRRPTSRQERAAVLIARRSSDRPLTPPRRLRVCPALRRPRLRPYPRLERRRPHREPAPGSNSAHVSGVNHPIGVALVVAGALSTGASTLLGLIAVVLAMINVAGGFVVTHRMLEMFNPKKK